MRTTARGRNPTPVVYVHGLGPKPPAGALQREWDVALFGRPRGRDTRMAYWADVLHPGPNPSGIRRPAAAVQAGACGAARRTAIRYLTERLVPDLAAYTFRHAVRRRIQARLQAEVLHAGGPLIVVAHSMGSIIAYDVLHALGDAVDVRLWVTIGSPLGLLLVQNYLAHPLIVPRGVSAWHNFADRLDPVALDRSLSGEFEPVGFIRDEWIVNRDALDPEQPNPHAARGYLSHPAVRRSVADAMD